MRSFRKRAKTKMVKMKDYQLSNLVTEVFDQLKHTALDTRIIIGVRISQSKGMDGLSLWQFLVLL